MHKARFSSSRGTSVSPEQTPCSTALQVLASFRMKAEFPRNKGNVFDGVVEVTHRMRRDTVPPSCRCRQLQHSINVRPLHVQ
jgi:hypothetical protein